MASLSLSNSSSPVVKRMLSEFLQEPQEPFQLQMRKLSKHGGMRYSKAPAFLKRVLAMLVHGRSSCGDNRKSSVLSSFSDHSDGHQLSPISVLELPYSDESSPSLDDHNEYSPTKASITVEEIPDKFALPHKRRRLLNECLRKRTEERILSFQGCLIFLTDLSNLNQMGASDSSTSGEEWNQFKAETREIGLCLEALIFDELREETILDMLLLHCT